jgi:hypothetical protein
MNPMCTFVLQGSDSANVLQYHCTGSVFAVLPTWCILAPLQSVLAPFRHYLLHLDDDENPTRLCSQLHRKLVGFHFINVPCEQDTASLQSKGVPDSLRWQQNGHPQKSGNALKHTKTPDWHAPLGQCKTWPRYLGSRCFKCCPV